MSFYLQALVLAAFASFLFVPQSPSRFIPITISTIWFLGVSCIYFQYGPMGQLEFYQNDQRFHWLLLTNSYVENIAFQFERLNSLRVPFTFPAYALSQVGLDVTLSLKFVSLCCALSNLVLIERFFVRREHKPNFLYFLMIAGSVTTFFSLLALRETMLMLCVTQFFIGNSLSGKGVSLVVIMLLRPHLAISVIFGQIWSNVFAKARVRFHFLLISASCILPVVLGRMSFVVANSVLYGQPLELKRNLILRDEFVQVFSAFAGLQFLSVAYQTVEFSTRSLLFIRMIFPEIVIIPLSFAITCFVFGSKLSRIQLSLLSGFVFFMAISSRTEFLSVRQSLPFMPAMGVVVLLSIVKLNRGKASSRIVETAL